MIGTQEGKQTMSTQGICLQQVLSLLLVLIFRRSAVMHSLKMEMITRVFKSLTCMPLILFKYYYKTDPEMSVMLNYLSHQVPQSNAPKK